MEDFELRTFDAKRDRWNGYNGDEWVKQAERWVHTVYAGSTKELRPAVSGCHCF